MEGVLALRVGKRPLEPTAMTFNHGEAVEFACGRAIGHGAEMAPGNLALGARGGFETDERTLLGASSTHTGEILPHKRPPRKPCSARRCRSTTAETLGSVSNMCVIASWKGSS